MMASTVKLKPRVFVFCRPYLVEDFKTNIAPLEDSYEFRLLTDGKKSGVNDTRARFYQRLTTATRPIGFSEADELDVVERCRLLRNLPLEKALQMLRATASVLSEELDAFAPRAVLSHMVDEYSTHLLAELARRRSIVYVGFAYSYFPEKTQITQFGFGSPLDVREPSDVETTETFSTISERTFRQNYLQKATYTKLRHLKAMLRYQVKRIVFFAKSRLEGDPLNLHYACLPFVVERRCWSDFPSKTDFHQDWQQRLDTKTNSLIKPVIYMPLGYFPEATIDYWIADKRILQYQELVLHICQALSPFFRVVVKEHLHMLGARSTAFYRKLRDLPGVVSVPPLEYSNDVLERADVVLIGAGSIGVESFIRGKPVVSFCNTSYWFTHADAAYLDIGSIHAWPVAIGEKIRAYVAPTEKQQLEFVRQCLRSTMRTQRPGRRWPICNPDDLSKTLNIAIEQQAGSLAILAQ